MTATACPVCLGETFEIRAKLVCRRCGAILETCCEGGPMRAGGCPQPSLGAPEGAQPPRPAPPADPRVG